MQTLINSYQKIGFTKFIALFSLIFGLLLVNFGERVALREGKGWDGVTFVYYAQHFDSLIKNRLINTNIKDGNLTLTHKVNRFFPSMVVHYSLKIAQIPINTPNIIETFAYYNLLCLVLASVFIGIIGQKFDLEEKSKWLLWFLLLFNFSVVKRSFYEPALTDLTAILLGISLITFWALDNWKGVIGLVIIGLIGAFVWQPITIYAYFLLLFPRNIKLIEQKNSWLNLAIWAVFGGIFFYYFANAYFNVGVEAFSAAVEHYFGQTPIYEKGLLVSGILATLFTGAYFGLLLKDCSLKNIIYFVKPNIIFRIIPIFLLYFLVNYLNSLVTSLASPTADVSSQVINSVANTATQSPLAFLSIFIYHPLAMHTPLGFIFLHASFFGAAFIVASFFYDSFTKILRQECGIGFILIFLASYQSAILNPQSRIGTAFFVFIAFVAVLMIDRKKWSNWSYLLLILINIFSSKIWLQIGDFTNLEFSWLRWYTSFGMWTNLRWVIIIGFLFCVFGGVLWILERKNWIIQIKKLLKI